MIGNSDTGQESEFSGHNHLQDPDGPFPGTMYSHEVYKWHLNRLRCPYSLFSIENNIVIIRKNKNKTVAWYTCAHAAATGCPAVAWVEAWSTEAEDGSTKWHHRFLKLSPYEESIILSFTRAYYNQCFRFTLLSMFRTLLRGLQL